jgi:hypothetical protein
MREIRLHGRGGQGVGIVDMVGATTLWINDLSFWLKGQTARQVAQPAVLTTHQVLHLVQF